MDLNNFFILLDKKINSLPDESKKEFIRDEFPNYPHIGRFIDPGIKEERDFFFKALENDLGEYSFDPLIAFEMKQIKYSEEILHPDCDCYRRSKCKERPIKTASHRDRILYACWNQYLSSLHKTWLSENKILDSVSAYVPETGKFNSNYAKMAFDYLQGRSEYSAVALDVKSFFDNIPHQVLKENIKELAGSNSKLSKVDFRLFKAVTSYTYIYLDQLKLKLDQFTSGSGMYLRRSHLNWKKLRELDLIKKNKGVGIPQGLPCSGVLANIAMMQFDLKMTRSASDLDSIYIRYADDIFIASPNINVIQKLRGFCQSELNTLNLPLAHKKTEEFNFKKGSTNHPKVSYLGMQCQGNDVSVRPNGVNKFYKEASQFIFSYVLTCRKRNIIPSIKKMRAIFSHSGSRNYYSYLRRASDVFEVDPRYKCNGIKGVLKNHIKWIDTRFQDAMDSSLTSCDHAHKVKAKCSCPLLRDS